MKTENYDTNIVGLDQLANDLGYKETSFHMMMTQGNKVIDIQSVLNFFEDNPGAVEAVFEWAEKCSTHAEALQDDNEEIYCPECDCSVDDCIYGEGEHPIHQ